MTERVMVDIETLGRDAGCVILSVGAVRFSEDGIEQSYYESVNRESCEHAGLETDDETLEWWQDQPEEAREVLTGGEDLEVVLDNLRAFYMGADEVWANSPAFDVKILEAAYDAVGLEPPWNFWETRDVRTIKALPGAVEPENEGVAHDALDDAKHQARVAAGTLAKMGGLQHV